MRPASLIAKDEEEAERITAQLAKADGDLLEAEANAQAEREAALQKRLSRQCEREGSEVDLLELATRWDVPDIVGYAPTFAWEQKPLSEKQSAILQRNGVRAPEAAGSRS